MDDSLPVGLLHGGFHPKYSGIQWHPIEKFKSENSYLRRSVVTENLNIPLVASAYSDGYVDVWDLNKIKNIRKMYIGDMVQDLQWSTDDKYIISATFDGKFKLFDLRCENSQIQMSSDYPISSCAMSDITNGGSLILGDLSANFNIYDIRANNQRLVTPGGVKTVSYLTSIKFQSYNPRNFFCLDVTGNCYFYEEDQLVLKRKSVNYLKVSYTQIMISKHGTVTAILCHNGPIMIGRFEQNMHAPPCYLHRTSLNTLESMISNSSWKTGVWAGNKTIDSPYPIALMNPNDDWKNLLCAASDFDNSRIEPWKRPPRLNSFIVDTVKPFEAPTYAKAHWNDEDDLKVPYRLEPVGPRHPLFRKVWKMPAGGISCEEYLRVLKCLDIESMAPNCVYKCFDKELEKMSERVGEILVTSRYDRNKRRQKKIDKIKKDIKILKKKTIERQLIKNNRIEEQLPPSSKLLKYLIKQLRHIQDQPVTVSDILNGVSSNDKYFEKNKKKGQARQGASVGGGSSNAGGVGGMCVGRGDGRGGRGVGRGRGGGGTTAKKKKRGRGGEGKA
eukprot:GHVL01032061.1.p1 GENE.GHVL01032061.1~~GHVL01032061.1.p1  ORF type:complete len:558 (+),score=146.45 GHVL01032061.1:45-1718(+)